MIKRYNLCGFLSVIFLTILFSSCFREKKLAYFQRTNKFSDTIELAKAYVPKIQTGDILSVYVNSLSAQASSFFNPYSSSGASSTTGAGGGNPLAQSSAPGFLVEASGTVELPLIGKIKVSGLPTAQAADTIKAHLKKYLNEPTVSVRVLNFKVSVLGEVGKPSMYVIPNEMVTLPELLSLAGDLTVYGRRDSLMVIRTEENKKVFGYINLGDREVFKSPYYYLHANDVVYVRSGKARAQSIDKTYAILPIIVSILTLGLYIIRN